VELAEEVDVGVPQAPSLHGSTRGVPAEVLWGSGRSRDRRRRGIARAERLTGGGSRLNSGHCWSRGREWRPREASWHRGEAAVGFDQGCGVVVRRVHGGAGALRGGAKRGWR
jgi:hypothetical protein